LEFEFGNPSSTQMRLRPTTISEQGGRSDLPVVNGVMVV